MSYLAFDEAPWWRRPTPRRAALALLLLLVTLALAAPPALRSLRARRSAHHADQAEVCLREQRYAEGFDETRLGLGLTPGDPRLLRLEARLLGAAGNPDALRAWERVTALPGSTDDDALDLVACALDLDQPQAARPVLDRFLGTPQVPPRALVLSARYRLRIHDPVGALRNAEGLRQHPAATSAEQLALATELDTHPDPAVAEGARKLLLPIAGSPGPERLAALRALIRRPQASAADHQTALQILGNLPPAEADSLEARVLKADATISLEPSRAREIADLVLPTLNPTTRDDLLVLAACLHRHQLFDRSLTFLTSRRTHEELPLFRARLEALAGAGQIAPAYRECLRDLPALEPLELEMQRLWLASRLQESDAAHAHQEKVLRLAGGRPPLLHRVTEFAAKHQLADLAVAAWKRLVNDPLESPRAMRRLWLLTDQSGDTWAARDYARRLAAIDTADHSLQVRIAQYDLLLREDIPDALATAEAHLTRPEFRQRARVEAAYACLLLDQRERARNHLALLETPGPGLAPDLRALHVALIAAFGHEAEARAEADSLALSDLRPEERDLVAPHRSTSR